jgi:uncharacterized protein YndB with AHSA1/START domain
MTSREEATAATDRTIVVTRMFDAPHELVFKAWTDPELMAQWFAPEPLTVPRAEIDLRVGGRFTLVMRDPDGNEFPSTGVYLEVDEPNRYVATDSVEAMPTSWLDTVNEARGKALGTPVPDGITTVTFDDVDGKTLVTFSEEWESKAMRDAYVEVQMIEGLDMTLDNLEKLLAKVRG